MNKLLILLVLLTSCAHVKVKECSTPLGKYEMTVSGLHPSMSENTAVMYERMCPLDIFITYKEKEIIDIQNQYSQLIKCGRHVLTDIGAVSVFDTYQGYIEGTSMIFIPELKCFVFFKITFKRVG